MCVWVTLIDYGISLLHCVERRQLRARLRLPRAARRREPARGRELRQLASRMLASRMHSRLHSWPAKEQGRRGLAWLRRARLRRLRRLRRQRLKNLPLFVGILENVFEVSHRES